MINTAQEYTGTCIHDHILEERYTDSYDSEYGRDDMFVERSHLTCLDCGAFYSELDEVWYI